jgi:hypothetical protein
MEIRIPIYGQELVFESDDVDNVSISHDDQNVNGVNEFTGTSRLILEFGPGHRASWFDQAEKE